MSNEISNERLEQLATRASWTCFRDDEVAAIAKELLALRKALSFPVYSRPAPAINLAELVPDAERIHNEFDDWREGWNACRAAILRNIEEAK